MRRISDEQLQQLVEAALFVAGKPLSIVDLQETVLVEFAVSKPRIKQVLQQLAADYQARGVNLVEVASGYRFQALPTLSPFLSYLWQEKAPKYSRAMLETLALIAYKQPITRGEIEQIRGVAVSSQIMRSLQERDWIKVIGHKDVPGRPALFATTKRFLDYFSLKGLADLPPFPELSLTDLAEMAPSVELQQPSTENVSE